MTINDYVKSFGSKQLNKGKALHDLRQWLLFADEGELKQSQLQEQANQASALMLVTNAIIVWNTVYMQAIIDQLKQEGYSISESDLQHISPSRSSTLTSMENSHSMSIRYGDGIF